MPNEYAIQNGRLITDSIITSSDNAEVCRFTVPSNIDLRLDALCIIQNQSNFTDGYSYRINGFTTKQDGYVTFVDGYNDGYGNSYDVSGTETDMKIYVCPDGYDLVFKTMQFGTDTFRAAVFANIYQVDNSNIYSTLTNTYSTLFGGTNEFVTMGNVLNFERTDSFSVCFWIKTTDSNVWILSKIDSAIKGYGILLSETGKLQAVLINSAFLINIKSISAINDGNWHHNIVTYDGTSVAAGFTFYIDGINTSFTIVDNSLGTHSISNTGPFNISGRTDGTEVLTGNMDEVGIYNKELSLTEVKEIYNLGVPVNLSILSSSSNLISWWRMGDGDTYPTLLDSSNSGFNGTMTNMEAEDIVADTP